ncbi:MAG: hypothetical protein NC117_05185 [Pseudoflavonifractor sp.]|nr:hypothetical protein [Pseudoflavonifractor sp.]
MKDIDSNKKFWDKTARLYALVHENINRRYYKTLTRLITSLFKLSHIVLEIGCGSGQLTRPLSPLAAKWIATDFSDKIPVSATLKVTSYFINFKLYL